jgi:hypothetical protein
MIDLDVLQGDLDSIELEGKGVIELFTGTVYSMICELKAAREVCEAASVHHVLVSKDNKHTLCACCICVGISKALRKHSESWLV